MDHKTYRTKILVFQKAFILLGRLKESVSDNQEKDELFALAAEIGNLLSQDNTIIPDIGMLLPIEEIQSLKDFDILADSETVARQAEAVKREIIELSNRHKLYTSYILVDGCPPRLHRNIDYIRNPDGKVVEPFDFWEDCIGVYVLKYVHKFTNQKIAGTYTFKTSVAAPGRQRQQVVADYLAETEHLIKAALDKQFPPITLPTGKRPTMIN